MKRSLAVVAVMILVGAMLASTASAQSKKGDNVATAGIGLGYPGAYGTSGMPPIFVSFDHAVIHDVAVGGIVSFSTSSYEWGGVTDYKWSYTYIFIGARGAYHFSDQIKDIPKDLDLYGGITMGYHIVSSKFDGKDEHVYAYSAGGGYFGFGFYGGARYSFSPKWAATGELGYDIGYLKLGISYKL
jgi:hypothetical protein